MCVFMRCLHQYWNVFVLSRESLTVRLIMNVNIMPSNNNVAVGQLSEKLL